MRSRKRTEEGSIEWMHTAEQDTDWIKLLLDTPAAAAELDAALLEDGPELLDAGCSSGVSSETSVAMELDGYLDVASALAELDLPSLDTLLEDFPLIDEAFGQTADSSQPCGCSSAACSRHAKLQQATEEELMEALQLHMDRARMEVELDAGDQCVMACCQQSRQQTLPGSSEAHQASNNQLTGPASEVQGPPRSPTWGQTDSATVSGSQSEQVHSDHARSDHASGPDSDSESVKEGRLNARPPSSADGTVDLYVQSASSASPASGSAGEPSHAGKKALATRSSGYVPDTAQQTQPPAATVSSAAGAAHSAVGQAQPAHASRQPTGSTPSAAEPSVAGSMGKAPTVTTVPADAAAMEGTPVPGQSRPQVGHAGRLESQRDGAQAASTSRDSSCSQRDTVQHIASAAGTLPQRQQCGEVMETPATSQGAAAAAESDAAGQPARALQLEPQSQPAGPSSSSGSAAATGSAQAAAKAAGHAKSTASGAGSAAATGPAQAGAQGAEEAERARQQARMERNRESAHHSRQRKKMQLHEAEQRCQELQTQNNHLTGLVSRLTAENAALHHHLAAVCQRTGTPLPGPVMPPVLAPGMQPGMMRPPFGPYGPPMGMPLPPHVLMGQTPKVPIQKLKPSRPAAPEKRKAGKPDAGTSSSDSAGLPTSVPTSQAPEGRGRKRARTAAGASTALLALCCFFVFMGPMGPAIPGIGNTGGGLGLEYAALPGAPVRAGGRVLTALDMLPDNDTASSEVAVSTIPGGQLDILWQPDTNLTGVGVQVNDRGAEALALQRLKDLAPVALFSDWGPGLASRHWKDFPQLADSILASDHFASPLVCEERFRFDASAVADPAAVRRQLQRYLGTMQTFRGRAVSGAMPLPPIGHMEEEARAFQDVDPDEPKPKATIGCSQKEDDEEDAEAIVSVMLPTKQLAGSADAYFTSLDQLYVVVLKPRKQYTTYACTLPKPILV